jgi:hypothetical protein
MSTTLPLPAPKQMRTASCDTFLNETFSEYPKTVLKRGMKPFGGFNAPRVHGLGEVSRYFGLAVHARHFSTFNPTVAIQRLLNASPGKQGKRI